MTFQGHPNLHTMVVTAAPSPATSGTSVTVSTAWATRVAALTLPVQAVVSGVQAEGDLDNSEIISITAADGGTGVLTIVRTRESTSARSILVGDRIRITLTSLGISALESWSNAYLAKTAAYTLLNADKGANVALGGSAFYALTVGAASGFDANYQVRIKNEDSGRGKKMVIDGLADFILYPGQSLLLYNSNGAWKVDRPRPDRWRLTGATTIYVDGSNGASGNDGLASGSGNALATIAQAVSLVRNTVDLAGQAVTVQIAAGTYTAGIAVTERFTGGGTVTFLGDATTPANVLLSVTSGDAVAVTRASVSLSGLKLATTTSGYGINAGAGAVVGIAGKLDFGACASSHTIAQDGGHIRCFTSYDISGAAPTHLLASLHGRYLFIGGTVTISGTPAFGTAFAFAQNLGAIQHSGVTFSGSATGVRYVSNSNSVIQTNGGGATYFPGGTGGSTATGGIYA